MKEGEEGVEHELRVGLPPHIASEELRQGLEQTATNLLGVGHGSGRGKEPIAVAERMGVLGAQRAHGGRANVTHEHVGPDVFDQLPERKHPPIIEGATLQ